MDKGGGALSQNCQCAPAKPVCSLSTTSSKLYLRESETFCSTRFTVRYYYYRDFWTMHPATQLYPGRPEYAYAGPVPGPRGLSWNPAMHPPWGYDMSAYQGYPPSSDGSPVQRSPPYHISSPTEPNSAGTPHNIRDILGGQDATTLASEIAKTGLAGYQKSPTSTTAPHGGVFGPEHAAMSMRSPTTPTAPVGMPYSSEVPSSFYMPAIGPRHHLPSEYDIPLQSLFDTQWHAQSPRGSIDRAACI